MERDIVDALKTDGKPPSKMSNFMDALMWNVKIGDKGAILTGSWALRRARLKQGVPLAEVVNEYESFSSDIQQSSDISRLSEVQLGGSLEQLFTMFKSSQRQYLSKELNAIKSLFQEGGTSPKNIKKVAKVMAIYHVALPIMFQYISNLGGWSEDDRKEYLRAGLLGSINGLFIAGDVVDGVIRAGLGLQVFPQEIPIVTVGKDIKQAFNKIDLDDITMDDMKEALNELLDAGQTFGLPTKQAKQWWSGVDSIIDGNYKEGVALLSGWSEYTVGKKKDKTAVPNEIVDKEGAQKFTGAVKKALEKGDLTEEEAEKKLKRFIKVQTDLKAEESLGEEGNKYYNLRGKRLLEKDEAKQFTRGVSEALQRGDLTEDQAKSMLKKFIEAQVKQKEKQG